MPIGSPREPLFSPVIALFLSLLMLMFSEPLTYGFVTADHIMFPDSHKGKWYAFDAPLQLAGSMIGVDPHKTRCKQGTQKA